MDLLSDAHLIEKVLSEGDGLAYSTLVSRYYGAAYRQACALVQDPVEAQDLVQEAFLAVHTQLRALRDPARFAGWLKRIVHTRCMRWHRQFRPQVCHSVHGPACPFEVEEVVDEREPSPLERLLRSELLAEIGEATADLEPRYRLPLVLHYLDRCSYEEVAETRDKNETFSKVGGAIGVR